MPPRLFLLITTHTTLHLERVLFGVAHSVRKPDVIAVSCDNDSPEIVSTCCRSFRANGLSGTVLQRPHMGTCRLAQVINNGLRHFMALQSAPVIQNADRVVVIQGDCCPGRTFLGEHERLGVDRDLVIGFRHDITEEQTARFSDQALMQGDDPVGLSPQQRASLERRHRRLEWHARLRGLGLAKAHKPKVLGADFSLRFEAFVAINGMDEEYVGYGSEDDDLGRRLYAAGRSVAIGVKQLELYHLWHETRKGQRWDQSSGVARFRLATPVRAVHGLDSPLHQPAVTTYHLPRDVT